MTHEECLAIVWGVLLLPFYLGKSQLEIRTDHHELEWLLIMIEATGNLTRLQLRLSELEFDVEFLADVKI